MAIGDWGEPTGQGQHLHDFVGRVDFVGTGFLHLSHDRRVLGGIGFDPRSYLRVEHDARSDQTLLDALRCLLRGEAGDR